MALRHRLLSREKCFTYTRYTKYIVFKAYSKVTSFDIKMKAASIAIKMAIKCINNNTEIIKRIFNPKIGPSQMLS